MFYFARCISIVFNSLLAQLVKYDVHTTCKIKFIPAIIYHILLLYMRGCQLHLVLVLKSCGELHIHSVAFRLGSSANLLVWWFCSSISV